MAEVLAHNEVDAALYDFARDLFWRRVRVMEALSGRIFADMPVRWRHAPD